MLGLILAAAIVAPVYTGVCIILNIMEGGSWDGTDYRS